MSLYTETIQWLRSKKPHHAEFLQAAEEICKFVVPIVNANEMYKQHNVLQRILSHQQIIEFSIVWEDDSGRPQVNTGWRIQHNNALGPYKGGTRFHPDLNVSILEFLALEQSLKNSLTQLSLGSAKGGADFNPRGRSKGEIRRFCNAYMRALHDHIGPNTDVPAGDINVGDEELGFMFGEYLRLSKAYNGALSGKPLSSGGSALRVQATGYGVIYFLEEMLRADDKQIEGQRVVISGAGNVAVHAAQKAIEKGAIVTCLSNSRGALFAEDGLSKAHINNLLVDKRGATNALQELAEETQLTYSENKSPWELNGDIAIPCATQNEIDEQSAKLIIKNFTFGLIEGANMPCTDKASNMLQKSNLVYAPGKAANAGGVIVSGFEMQQNAALRYEDEKDLDQRLQDRMRLIHQSCVEESNAQGNTQINYVQAANIAGFRRLADAIVAQGF